LKKLKAGVEKTRAGLVSRLEDTLSVRKEIDADLLDELGVRPHRRRYRVQTTSEILERIRQGVSAIS